MKHVVFGWVLLLPGLLQGQTLQWDPPSVVSNITSYVIYAGVNSGGPYPYRFPTESTNNTFAVPKGILPVGKIYFIARSRNDLALPTAAESMPSNEVPFVNEQPRQVQGLRAFDPDAPEPEAPEETEEETLEEGEEAATRSFRPGRLGPEDDFEDEDWLEEAARLDAEIQRQEEEAEALRREEEAAMAEAYWREQLRQLNMQPPR